VSALLREGIAAVKAGQRDRARDLLMRVVQQDEENVHAWLWLSGVVDTLEDRAICLDNVLVLDPDNQAARKGLAQIRRQLPEQFPAEFPPGSSHFESSRPESAQESDEEPPAQLFPTGGDPNDLYLCPYCASPTQAEDRRCGACGGNLWLKYRRQEGYSNMLWFAVGTQTASLIRNVFVIVLMLLIAQFLAGTRDPVALVRAYLGLPTNLSPDLLGEAFLLVSRPAFLSYALLSLFSLVVMGGLFTRTKVAFYLYVLDAVLNLLSALSALTLGEVIQGLRFALSGLAFFFLTGLAGFALAVIKGYLAFQIYEDFFLPGQRVLFRLESTLVEGTDFLARADFYLDQKMWAMAAIHLQRAAFLLPNRLDCRLALATAYIRCRRYGLAAQVLEDARRISPGDARVRELEGLLSQLGGEAEPGSKR
jgi:hypothetical protein